MYRFICIYTHICIHAYNTSVHLHILFRGMAANVTAVSVPIAMTIFLTDVLRSMKHAN
jgi:hypothetical protein